MNPTIDSKKDEDQVYLRWLIHELNACAANFDSVLITMHEAESKTFEDVLEVQRLSLERLNQIVSSLEKRRID